MMVKPTVTELLTKTSNRYELVIATSKSSVGIYLANTEGVLNYCDGIIKGTRTSLYLESGATAYVIPIGYMEKIEKQMMEYGEYTVSYLSNEKISFGNNN